MLNKKNIAMAMAAVSVATPVASVFAAPVERAIVESTNETEIQAIKDKVAELIVKKYTKQTNLLKVDGLAGQSVYTIKLALVNAEGTMIADSEETCSSYADFEKKFDAKFEALKNGENLRVEYVENAAGHRVLEDGTIVDFEEAKYIVPTLPTATEKFENAGDVKIETAVDGSKTIKVKLTDTVENEGRFIEVKVGDTELDLAKPIYRQVNGYYVDAKGNSIQKVEDTDDLTLASIPNGVVDGFFAKQSEILIKQGTTNDVICKEGFEKHEFNASDIYNVEEGRLTVEGNELVKKVNELKKDADYSVTPNADGDVLTITNVKDNKNEKLAEVKIVKDDADKKGLAFDFMKKFILGTERPEVETVAGMNRYQTAVEVSELGWRSPLTGKNGEKAVVLVSGDNKSLVDGLTATPLAASLNDAGEGAPVLLTKADSIPTEVMDEIERLGANKVYIVGGTTAVNESVANTLTNRYGIEVERLSGNTRYETSLEVAKKVDELNGTNAGSFLVGGKAEADALSVAAIAGEQKLPIILTPANSMTSEIKDAVETAAGRTTIVGGSTVVSDDIVKQLVDMGASYKRLEGINRNETNAAVLKEFYTDKEDYVIVAKSNNEGLVDALGAGALGAKYSAPVVLSGKELTESQEEAVKTVVKDNTLKVQVGYGIASAVAKFFKGL